MKKRTILKSLALLVALTICIVMALTSCGGDQTPASSNAPIQDTTDIPGQGGGDNSGNGGNTTTPPSDSTGNEPADKPCTHNFVTVSSVDATCTQKGSQTLECSLCGETKTEEIDLAAHEFTKLVKQYAATCIKDGYDEYKCIRCTETTQVKTDDAHGNHVLEYVKTVKPTCIEVGYKIYGCKADPECTIQWKNPDLSTPNEPLLEDITEIIDHQYAEATVDGLLACYMCNKGYRDITTEIENGEDAFCMGCGKEPCECGTVGEWGGYTAAKEPFAVIAQEEFVITAAAETDEPGSLQIGNGMIVLKGTSDTQYTVYIYSSLDGEADQIFVVSGKSELVNLEGYDTVCKVKILATTDATAQFYAPEN